MIITLTFKNSEAKVELRGENDAERRLLAVVYENSDNLKVEEIKNDGDGYSGWNRPYQEPPTALVLKLLKRPEELPVPDPSQVTP